MGRSTTVLALVLLLCAAAVGVVTGPAAAVADGGALGTRAAGLDAGLAVIRQAQGTRAAAAGMVNTINQDRRHFGVPALPVWAVATREAAGRSQSMAQAGRTFHGRLDGMRARLGASGVAELVVALDGGRASWSLGQTMAARLINSAPHRQTLLSQTFNVVGCAVTMSHRGVAFGSCVFARV